MPSNPTPQDFIKSAADILKDPARLAPKLRLLRKYSLLGPTLRQEPLGKICTFHMGRSGSTVLARLLDQHPQVYWGHEIYMPAFKPHRRKAIWDVSLEVDPRALLEKSSRWVGRRYFGFEVKFWHLERTNVTLADYVAVLRDFGVDKFIILERKNLLRRFVSRHVLVAHERTQVKTTEQTSLRTVNVPVNFTRDNDTVDLPVDFTRRNNGELSLVEFFQFQQAQLTQLRGLLKDEPVLELSSAEDIFPNPVAAYQRACEFIGIEPVAVEIPIRRVNPYPLKAMISNFAEVEQALQNTPFEWMLYTDD